MASHPEDHGLVPENRRPFGLLRPLKGAFGGAPHGSAAQLLPIFVWAKGPGAPGSQKSEPSLPPMAARMFPDPEHPDKEA
jgi:hypothetical protein